MKIYPVALLFLALPALARATEGLNESPVYQQAQAALAAQAYERAYDLFLDVAEKEKNPLAAFNLGLFYRFGWGRERDPVAACRWFERSAQGKIPYGQQLLGECLEEGIHRQADPAQAAHWYREAARGSYVLANCYLARLYMQGLGVAKDPQKALNLCQRAASGSTQAALWMGRFYLAGDDSIRDVQKAAQWFDVAAQYGLPEAFYYQGKMIEQGFFEGVTLLDARHLYEKAAAEGFVRAYYPTARLYFNAPPEPGTNRLSAHDLAKAYMWLSVTQKQSREQRELTETDAMLGQVLSVMPKTWRTELDKKVANHLAKRQ